MKSTQETLVVERSAHGGSDCRTLVGITVNFSVLSTRSLTKLFSFRTSFTSPHFFYEANTSLRVPLVVIHSLEIISKKKKKSSEKG